MSLITSPPNSLNSLSDSALMEVCARADDGEAFRVFVDRHADAIRAYLVARVGPDVGDGLVGDTFAEAWIARANFDASVDSARPWLYGIATVLVRRYARGERRWQQGIAQGEFGIERVVRSDPGRALISDELRTAIAQLSRREREVLLLVALGDLSVADAARVLEISDVAARTRLRRARAQVIAALEGTTQGEGRHE